MATFKMPAKCSWCRKRCDGNIWCSEECQKKEAVGREKNRKVMDDFFSQFYK